MRKKNACGAAQDVGPKHWNQLTLADRVGGNERGLGLEALREFACLPKPTHNVIERSPELIVLLEDKPQIAFLVGRLRTQSRIRRVSANERVAAFVFEIDLRLVQWCAEQIVRT